MMSRLDGLDLWKVTALEVDGNDVCFPLLSLPQ